jgi:uncharacterized protein YrzB (UPF0473 family)
LFLICPPVPDFTPILPQNLAVLSLSENSSCRLANFLLILQPYTGKIEVHRTNTGGKPMNEEYGSDFISITDEDGNEYELEVLAELEYNGSRYLALVPADADENSEDLEVSILRSVEENGEQMLEAIEDDQELEEVYQALMDLMYEEEDGAEDET